MTRGEIWWIDFGLAYGSTPQGRRPAIIVQNDNFNASRILTTGSSSDYEYYAC